MTQNRQRTDEAGWPDLAAFGAECDALTQRHGRSVARYDTTLRVQPRGDGSPPGHSGTGGL